MLNCGAALEAGAEPVTEPPPPPPPALEAEPPDNNFLALATFLAIVAAEPISDVAVTNGPTTGAAGPATAAAAFPASNAIGNALDKAIALSVAICASAIPLRIPSVAFDFFSPNASRLSSVDSVLSPKETKASLIFFSVVILSAAAFSSAAFFSSAALIALSASEA